MLLQPAVPCFAGKIEVVGAKQTTITFAIIQEFRPLDGTQRAQFYIADPDHFTSPAWKQRILARNRTFSPLPSRQTLNRDYRGNQIVSAIWEGPTSKIIVKSTYHVQINLNLKPFTSRANFPLLRHLKRDIRAYLVPTVLVQSTERKIRELATSLAANETRQSVVVENVLTWVVDRLTYQPEPSAVDALSAFKNKRGNCQSYAHLAAALLRAVGIPTRIVNGVVAGSGDRVRMGAQNNLDLRKARGRYSWIEIYFPDLGWIPADPMNSAFFVGSDFLRLEVGLDAEEAKMDGLVQWENVDQSAGVAFFRETISIGKTVENGRLVGRVATRLPQNIFLQPVLEKGNSLRKKPLIRRQRKSRNFVLKKVRDKLVFGNVTHPEDQSFERARNTKRSGTGQFELRKNMLSRTAENVTGGRLQSQLFVMPQALRLEKIDLLLQLVGGSGALWLNLHSDRNGRPGEVFLRSTVMNYPRIASAAEFNWVSFVFHENKRVLPAGTYWMSLGYSGAPVVDWFFVYGKPLGPFYGTRHKDSADTNWSTFTNSEFNYRVVGALIPGR